jgi:hypothetical protein
MTTPRRTVRVPDPLWDRATEAAKVEGKTVTEVVLQGLTRFSDRVLGTQPPSSSLPLVTDEYIALSVEREVLIAQGVPEADLLKPVARVTKATPATRCSMLRGTHRVKGVYVCKDCGKTPAEHL